MSKQRQTTSKTRPAAAPKGVAQSLKESLDHIILAFILAFVFRAFVVEAFVIPTGSMATTLLGAHTNFACRHCGFAFSLSVDQRTGLWPAGVNPICPNSHHKTDLGDDSAAPIKRNGDRILVQKYIYNFTAPKRWDVIVFKDPQDGKTNLIKRAIGLPEEKVEVIAGDVYINDQIVRKTRAAQSILWHVVYENDYQTKDQSRQPRWQRDVTSNWKTEGRIFEVEPLSDEAGSDWIRYQDRANLPVPNDFNEYNGLIKGRRLNAVSDVRLRFIWEPNQAEGTLLGVLGDEKEQFEFRYLSKGSVQIARAGDERPLIESKAPRWKVGEPIRVDFAKADYRLWIALDRVRVLESKDEQYYADALAASTRPRTLPVVKLGASGATGRVLHLGLDRDVYYTSPKFTEPGVPRTIYGKPGNGTEGNPIILGADQYFMLGDNSPSSKDSRLWYTRGDHLSDRADYQIGAVPYDQIIGRAFFVYWPAGFRPVATQRMLPFIPNVGNMRLIR